jgi:ferredoxin
MKGTIQNWPLGKEILTSPYLLPYNAYTCGNNTLAPRPIAAELSTTDIFMKNISDHAFSAGLQLNTDLTDSDPATLITLARAELNRHSSQTHRSYILDADPRVAVLGTNAAMLHDFMDTYSGVLHISPILLRGYEPDLPRAQELHIIRDGHSFEITFTVRQAIDFKRCSYCGECGAVCPKQCISEKLFLNFHRCNHCTECVTSCPQGAIDLHAIEEHSLSSPAIMALDGAEEFLPQGSGNIYTPSTLPALFAQIYSREVEEIIDWNSTFCQYSGRLQTGCSLCMDSCHYNAIRQDTTGVIIDHISCTECGACLSSCPSAALRYKRFDDVAFLDYFRTAPLSPGSTVVIGKEATLHQYWWYGKRQRHSSVFFLEFPQPTALHALHFLLLYAMGAKQVIVLEKKNGSPSPQMPFSNRLLSAMGRQDSIFRTACVEELSALLHEPEQDTEPRQIYHDFSYSNRREKLVHLLQFLILQKPDKPAIINELQCADFGEISCDAEKCTGCMACVNSCHMGALSTQGHSYSLIHRPSLCIQCGICVTICPETALSARQGLTLRNDFFGKKTVAQAEPVRCKSCGKIFGTRQSLEKVMAILTSKKIWDAEDDLLSYCEECRVVTLYQSLEK